MIINGAEVTMVIGDKDFALYVILWWEFSGSWMVLAANGKSFVYQN